MYAFLQAWQEDKKEMDVSASRFENCVASEEVTEPQLRHFRYNDVKIYVSSMEGLGGVCYGKKWIEAQNIVNPYDDENIIAVNVNFQDMNTGCDCDVRFSKSVTKKYFSFPRESSDYFHCRWYSQD